MADKIDNPFDKHGMDTRAVGVRTLSGTGGRSFASTLDSLTDVNSAGAVDKDILQFSSGAREWQTVRQPDPLFLGAVNSLPTNPVASAVHYLLRGTTVTVPIVLNPAPVAFDARMLTPLRAGTVPSTADPSQSAQDTMNQPVALTPTNWYVTSGTSTYQVTNTAGLVARITAGETTIAQFIAGANPPVAAVTTGNTTVNLIPGFYRWDGTAWTLLPNNPQALSTLTDVNGTKVPVQNDYLAFTGVRWEPTTPSWLTASTVLNDLADVTTTSVNVGQYLSWDGRQWVNTTPAANTLSALTDTDMTTTAPAVNNVLKYSGTKWIPGAVSLNELTNLNLTGLAGGGNVVAGDVIGYDGANWGAYRITATAMTETTKIPTVQLLATELNKKQNSLPAIVVPADQNKILSVKTDGSLGWVQATPPATHIKEPVASQANLPTTGNADGDIVITKDTSTMYVWIVSGNVGSWHSMGSAVGGAMPGLPSSIAKEQRLIASVSGTPGWQDNTLANLQDINTSTKNGPNPPVPNHGDTLYYSALLNEWTFSHGAAHIDDWANSSTYVLGDVVAYNGKLWRCSKKDGNSRGVAPVHSSGTALAMYRTQRFGHYITTGPVPLLAVETGDPTAAPTNPTGVKANHTWVTLRWQDASHWALWKWDQDFTGWTPGSPPPAYTWSKLTVTGGSIIHRSLFKPPTSIANDSVLLWIYDTPAGTATPVVGQQDWEQISLTERLESLDGIDTRTNGLTQGSILVWNQTSQKWVATPDPTLDLAKGGTVRGSITFPNTVNAGDIRTLFTGLKNINASYRVTINRSGANGSSTVATFIGSPGASPAGYIEISHFDGSGTHSFSELQYGWASGSYVCAIVCTEQVRNITLNVSIETDEGDLTGIVWGDGGTATHSTDVRLYTNKPLIPDFGCVGDVKQSTLTETQFNFMMGTNSKNWMLCDGRACANTTYAVLTGKANVPDFRGAFIRMAGTNGNGTWAGGNLMDWQDDSIASHNHGMNTNRGWTDWRSGGNSDPALVRQGGGDVTGNTGGTETRPKNFSLNFFIKVN